MPKHEGSGPGEAWPARLTALGRFPFFVPPLPSIPSLRLSGSPSTVGRKKIEIKKIANDRARQVTFTKRKGGLLKKAEELSILCNSEVFIAIFSSNDKLYEYCSAEQSNKFLKKYLERREESKLRNHILSKAVKVSMSAQDPHSLQANAKRASAPPSPLQHLAPPRSSRDQTY